MDNLCTLPRTAELIALLEASHKARILRSDARLLHGKNSEEYRIAKQLHENARADLRAYAKMAVA